MRCLCCNRALRSSEIIWYPEQKRHEELCLKCRTAVHDDLLTSGVDNDSIPIEVDEVTKHEPK
jgi:hypothetical protein